MGKKRKSQESGNTKLAALFGLLLLFILTVSFSFKFIDVIRRGKYQEAGKFAISLRSDSYEGVAVFSHADKTINIIDSGDETNIEAPVNAYLFASGESFNKGNLKSRLLSSLLKYHTLKTNLTIIDIARINLFAQNVKDASIAQVSYAPGDQLGIFTDVSIEKEKLGIEIVNATGESGVATALARKITNMGGNVVLVSTDNETQKSSKIYYSGDRSYTLNKLHDLFGYGIEKKDSTGIADIVVVMGEDSL